MWTDSSPRLSDHRMFPFHIQAPALWIFYKGQSFDCLRFFFEWGSKQLQGILSADGFSFELLSAVVAKEGDHHVIIIKCSSYRSQVRSLLHSHVESLIMSLKCLAEKEYLAFCNTWISKANTVKKFATGEFPVEAYRDYSNDEIRLPVYPALRFGRPFANISGLWTLTSAPYSPAS